MLAKSKSQIIKISTLFLVVGIDTLFIVLSFTRSSLFAILFLITFACSGWFIGKIERFLDD